MRFKLRRSVCIMNNDLGYNLKLCSVLGKIFVTISIVGMSTDDNILLI